MRAKKKELNIQIGKRLQIVRENMLILYEKYKIDPTYLITGEKNLAFDVEIFLANCSREERDKFIDRMLAYMRKLITNLQ